MRTATAQPLASAVDAVNMTVSDVDRAADFYSRVLQFQKVSDVEVAGEPYERLEGVFGLRMRVVRMRLGEEHIELTEYLAPKGRPVPVESHSNDRSFQHIAIIVSDMDRAYDWLRRNKVEHCRQVRSAFLIGIRMLRAYARSILKIPTAIRSRYSSFLPTRAGKVAPKSNKLFLGIDHTAIVVAR